MNFFQEDLKMQTKKSKFLIILVMGLMLLWMASNGVAALLNESFTGTTFPPDGWTVYNFDGGDVWSRYTSYYNTSPACARIYYDLPNNDWLITPRLTVATNDSIIFYRRAQSTSTETLLVRVSTSGSYSDTSSYALLGSVIYNATTWVRSAFSLSSYVGQNIYIAFHYKCYNKWGFAIDDVQGPTIYSVADDMATMSIDNPLSGATLTGNASLSVKATVKNFGTNPQNQVPVNLQIAGPGGYSYADVESTGSLNQSQTQQITFSPNWTVPNVMGGYTIKVWTALSGDMNPGNDTVTITVNVIPDFYTQEGFEGTLFPPEGWARFENSDNSWARTSGSAHSGTYKARARGQNAWLFTPRMEVTTGDTLVFWYRAESATYPTSFRVRLSTSTNQTDTSTYTTILADYPNVTSTTYLQGKIDLGGYKGKVFIAFHRYYGQSDSYYLYLDDVALPHIYVPPADVGVTMVFEPPVSGHTYKSGTPDSIGMEIRNFGSASQSNFYVHYDLVFDEGRDSVLHTASLAAGTRDTIYAYWTPEHMGTDTIYGWTALSGDENSGNDRSKLTVTIQTAGLLLYEGFEGTFPPAGWTLQSLGTYTAPWTKSSTYAHSGTYSARGYYSSSGYTNEWMITPAMDLSAKSVYTFEFWKRFYGGSGSYVDTLEILLSEDGGSTWPTQLAIWTPDSTDNTSFVLVSFALSSTSNNAKIAFRYASKNGYGSYVDDVAVYTPGPRIAIDPDTLIIPMVTDQILDTSLFISNVGGATLTYSIAENPAAAWLTETPSSGDIPPVATDTITLHLDATGYGLGSYSTVLEITSNSETKAHDYVPVTMRIGGPHVTVDPESLHVAFCPPGTKDTSLVLTSDGDEDLVISGVRVVQTLPKDVKFYMGTLPHEEPQQGKEDKTAERSEESLKRKMLFDSGGPDNYGYFWIDSDEPGGPAFNWIEISGTGTPIVGLGDDTNLGKFPIGFTFNFYGTNFDSIRACSNGWFSFTSTATSYTNYALPNSGSGVPENLLAIFWDDMNFGLGGSAYYQTIGDQFIIEYKDAPRFSYGYLYTYEMILDKTCGTITYQYLSMQPGMLNSATIGIQNGLKNDGLTIAYDEYYVHDSLAIQIQPYPFWVSIDPCNLVDTLEIGESDTLGVTFDSRSYISGNFRGEIRLTTNAPGQFTKIVPVAMDLLGPELSFSADSIADTCQEGGAVQNTMTIQNTGDCPLIFNIAEGCSWISVSPTADTLDPTENTLITITEDCSDLYAGNYLCELQVYSNDADQQPYKGFKIYKHVGPDPDIAVSPDSFYIGIYAGYTKDTAMTISNTGDGHLVWGTAIEEIGKGTDTTLYESFEGTFPPADWLVVNNDGGTQQWAQNSTYAHTGTYSASCRWESSTMWNDDWLITPRISIGGNDTLSFWYQVGSISFPESLEVRLSTTTNDVSAFTTLLWAGSQLLNLTWEQQRIELGKYARGQVYIAFVYKGLDELRFYLDDVTVESYAGPWLTVDPLSGITDPHSSDGAALHFSAVGYEEDKYANLWVASNDPDESPVLVPVHMAILGPNYSVSPPETLVIDALEGQLTDGHVYMQNYGGHAPLAYKMTDPVDWLSESPDTAEVPIDGEQDVTVTVDGNLLIAGDYETYLDIKTNDFEVPYDTIIVIVHMGPNPDIRVEPDSFRVEVLAGGTKDTSMTVYNDGDGHLKFEITTEETGLKLAGFNPGTNRNEKPLSVEPKEQDPSKSVAESGIPISFAPGHGEVALSGVGGGAPLMSGDTILTEGFEGGVVPPAGWTSIVTDPSYTWVIYNYNPHSGSYYTHCVYDPSLNPQDEWLVTPALNLKEIGASGHVSFWWNMSYYWAVDPYDNYDLECWISTDGGSTWSTMLWTEDSVGVFTNWVWYEAAVDIAKYRDFGNVKLGWRYVGVDGAEACLDDITIERFAPPWLTVSPAADTTDPHTSMNVTVTFDATEILGGEKFGNIIIASNDPDESPWTVPVHMIVAGAQYAISPESLHIEALENQYTNAHLIISNPGGQGPLSYKMTDPVAWLTENPDTTDVPPDGQQDVTVRVDGYQLIAGNYLTQIVIKTNAVNVQYDTIPVTVHMGPDAELDIAPTSLNVAVIPGHTKIEKVKVSNLGGGHLGFVTEVVSGGPKLSSAGSNHTKVYEIHKRNAENSANSPALSSKGDTNNPAHLSIGGAYTPGTPLQPKGDTLFMQLPMTPDESWSFGTSDQGAGYKVCEDFWGLTASVSDLHFWGLCLIYSGGWLAGDPNNLVFDITFYSDPPDLPSSPPTNVLCTYTDVVPTWEGTGQYYIGFEMYAFDVAQLNPPCELPDGWGWVSIQSKSAGQGYDWFMWASAQTGDGFSCQENGDCPYYYDDAMILTGVTTPPCPISVSPVADTLDPYSFVDLLVTIDGTAFAPCDSETLQCNLVFYTNDPDESQVMVPVTMWCIRGDVDDDGMLNVVDVVFLLNYLFVPGSPAPDPLCLADVDKDGDQDSDDALYLISYLFLYGPPPELPLAPKGTENIGIKTIRPSR